METETIQYILFGSIIICFLWAVWFGTRITKPKVKSTIVETVLAEDKRYLPNEEFCSKCLMHNYFWTGGGSWALDRCPRHNKDDGDVVLWKNMNMIQRNEAHKMFRRMWNEKYPKDKKSIHTH